MLLTVIISRKFYLLFSLLSLQLLIIPPRSCLGCFPGGQLVRRRPRREPPLMYDEHVPNVAEDSVGASGRPGLYIKATDRRYRELVENFNQLIVFRSKADGNVSRKMSVRCKEKVDTLAMLVTTQWPGLKLRVVRGWVEKHQRFRLPVPSESLHYEGRAVDVTTSDMDQTKYGMLARLAVQAGFDWVHYEHKSHIHASVKSDASRRNSTRFQCFPANATVFTDTGRRKSVSDLQAGENVLAYSRETDRLVYSPFIAHLHTDDSSAEPARRFLRISTENGTTLTISQEHLIFVSARMEVLVEPNQTEQHQSFRIIFAENVEFGDFLLVRKNTGDGDSTNFHMEKVDKISMVHSQGLYAPLTAEGTIVVDDVIVSCYAAVNDHWLAHKAMSPLRLWNWAKSWSRDFLPTSFYSKSNNATKVIAANGVQVHWYANLLWSVADIIERLHLYNFWER